MNTTTSTHRLSGKLKRSWIIFVDLGANKEWFRFILYRIVASSLLGRKIEMHARSANLFSPVSHRVSKVYLV
jgi:hypothetical protein